MGHFNVFLVEDDEVDVMNVQRAFKKNNFTNPLVVANNGEEALEKLATGEVKRPCVIMLDLNMPRMGGIEFLRRIRQDNLYKSLTVVVLTTSNEEKDKVASYNMNVAGYIVKPVIFEKFVAAMADIGKYWTLSEYPT